MILAIIKDVLPDPQVVLSLLTGVKPFFSVNNRFSMKL